MVIHVRDDKTDALVRELARKRGISLTDAVREAVSEALAAEKRRTALWNRTADIRAKMAAFPRTGKMADKAFFDSLSGQGDD